ncbi:MAG: response regulator [Myxococcales bacterium]|nr:response regulator [Myxococcales bacterium]
MPLRVLIVDDEVNHRRTLAIRLRAAGFLVADAGNGPDALTVLDDFPADVAIVDLMMPGIDGIEVARRLTRRRGSLRVILTSAYHLTESQVDRANVDLLGFLPKPYDVERLVEYLLPMQPGRPADAGAGTASEH